jgi:hypothetical protein
MADQDAVLRKIAELQENSSPNAKQTSTLLLLCLFDNH